MAKINTGRAIVGGLLAGLVINVSEGILNMVVLAGPMDEAMKARNLPPVDSSAITLWIILSFLLGIVTVWLYAAIRPRFGPGVGTAVMAGLAVFFLTYCYPILGMAGMGFFPKDMTLITLAWGLVEILVASVAGSWAYTE